MSPLGDFSIRSHPVTDSVYLHRPGIKTEQDIQQTLRHEGITHHGLRLFMNKKDPHGFNKLCDTVWNMMQIDAVKSQNIRFSALNSESFWAPWFTSFERDRSP